MEYIIEMAVFILIIVVLAYTLCRSREEEESASEDCLDLIDFCTPTVFLESRADYRDLHGYDLKSAKMKVDSFLQDSVALGRKKVSIITGQRRHRIDNLPVLKPMVEKYLSHNNYKYGLPF